jgi:branched-chain amino acid transport system permease protein
VNRHNSTRTIAFVILAVILLALPIVLRDPYIIHILIMVGISIILCASLRLVFMTGIWNLGQIAFYAIGAYTLTLLMVYYDVSFWLALPLAGIAAAAVSIGFGYLTIRVRGLYFLMLTVAFVEIIRLTIIAVPFLGAQRVMNIPPPNPIVIPFLLRIEFISKTPYYYLALALVAITLAILYLIERSRIGGILKSIATSEPLCESVGIDTTRYKVIAFVICSFFAGIAGGFYAPYIGIIAPGSFTAWTSIMVFLSLVVGGVASFWGPVIGAAFMTVLPEVLRGAVSYEPMVSGIILLLVLFFLPGGLVSLPGVIRSRMMKRKGTEYKGDQNV